MALRKCWRWMQYPITRARSNVTMEASIVALLIVMSYSNDE